LKTGQSSNPKFDPAFLVSLTAFVPSTKPTVEWVCIVEQRRYNERMKTLTITEGRGRLGYWLKKAVAGEDIGFVMGDKVVALRPVEVYSGDYALQEYGWTPEEMAKAGRRIHGVIEGARKRGEVTRFTGSKNDFR